jgi:multiple sugar transport system substrate-binding protein
MSVTAVSRRTLLQAGSALTALSLLPHRAAAQAGGPIAFATWSAAVDTVKSHLDAFEKKSGIKVAYSNAPWAQYREAMITKFVGKAPVDVLWVSDSWLPEFVDAGWIAPVDQYKTLMDYNADTDKFSIDSMVYKGKQYGITYYTDYMGFIYNEDLLKKAGYTAPPKTWAEVTEMSKAIKAKGLSEYPMLLSMAQESWLIEFMTAMVYSFGGHFADDKGAAVMADPKGGAVQALQWIMDAVQRDKIVSPACVETGELAGLKSFGAGQHAFGLIPKYRLRTLNDPAQSQIAGKAQIALMPAGPNGDHSTVGWMRFYGMTPSAAADLKRAEAAVKLMEWFGGKADGQYTFQKLLFKDVGSGFGVKSLFQDPEIRAAYEKYGDIKVIEQQQALAKKKDVIAPWFGEWNEVNGAAWQQAIGRKISAEEALKRSGAKWDQLKKQG